MVDRLWDKFVEEFDYIRSQAVGSLATFLNYIQYEYMVRDTLLLVVFSCARENACNISQQTFLRYFWKFAISTRYSRKLRSCVGVWDGEGEEWVTFVVVVSQWK